MAQYFETRASFDKTMENGAVKKVTEVYLVDAMSCSEAEARTIEALKPYMSGDFYVKVAKQTKISEVIGCDDADWYLAKVAFESIDEKSGKEKLGVSQILVGAGNFEYAYDTLTDHLKNTVSYCGEPVSLSETQIVDVFNAK